MIWVKKGVRPLFAFKMLRYDPAILDLGKIKIIGREI
jgi:hypothetical protein